MRSPSPIPGEFYGLQRLKEKGDNLRTMVLDAADDFEKLAQQPPLLCFVHMPDNTAALAEIGEIPSLDIIPVERKVLEHHIWVGRGPESSS